MKKTSISGFGVCVLGLLLVAFMGRLTLAQTGRTERQKSENPPLSTTSNSLSNFFGQKQPVLQKNYKNPEDLWLLYSPDFDRLSGNAQSYLLRKYGIQEFTLPRRDGKVNDEGLDLLNRTQSETSSATAGSNIVVVYNDAGLPFYGSAISFSKDGGRTWKQTFPPVFAFGEGLGDPVVAAGPDDIFYFSFLAFNGSGFSTIGLTRSIDGGATWSKLVNATAGVTGGTNFHDKEWMAVDKSNSQFHGNIYIAWTRFTRERFQKSGIGFVRSSDGGRTWSPFKLIGRPTDADGFVQGPMIAVGPGGEVYIAYFDSRIPGVAVLKSTDGGESFGNPATAIQDQSLQTGRILSGGFAIAPFPSIAVDTSTGPNRGTVYLTTNVKPEGGRDESNVTLVKSTDGGNTWSSPAKVNDDETDTDQFQPSLAVAPDGTLGVMWYDRRNDPGNNVLLDVYMATSTDGGRTFSRNRRVTPGNWMLLPTPFGLRSNYHGDYNQMSAGSLGFVMNWSDDRSGTDSDISVAVHSTADAQSQPSDFVISAKTPAMDGLAGASTTFKLTGFRIAGFNSSVTLEGDSRYTGFQYRFSGDPVSGEGEAVLTVEVRPDTPSGTYPLTITGKAGGLVRTTGLRLTVHNSTEVPSAPGAISDIRLTLSRPKVAVDNEGTFHAASLDGNSSSQLKYTRHRSGVQVGSSSIVHVTDSNVSLTDHSIGVDGAGNITVVWRQINSQTRIANVFLSRSIDRGATFSDPVNITNNSSSRVSILSPSMAVAKSGPVHLAFVQHDRDTGFRDIFYVVSSDGGATFSPKVNVSKSPARYPDYYGDSPVMATDSSESIMIAYIFSTPDVFGDIYFSHSTDGLNFSTPVQVTRSGLDSLIYPPSIAIDPSGNINVIYLEDNFEQDNPDMYLVRSTDGGSKFSDPVLALRLPSEVGITASLPSLGVDSNGNLGIAWPAFVSGPLFPGGRDVLFCRSTNGGQTFSPVVNISNNVGQQRTFPLVITNESGQLAVVWEDETGGNSQIFVAYP